MMKHLSIILASLFITIMVNAQTEDEVYIGKGKTFGNYQASGIIIPDVGKDAKPLKDYTVIKGLVVRLQGEGRNGWCEEDCLTIFIKRDDSSIVRIGTKDFGFTVPKEILGKQIMVQGKDSGQISGDRKRRDAEKHYQKDIQFAASGIMVID